MNEKQFALVIKGKRFRPKTKKALHRVLVCDESRKTVVEDMGLDLSWFGSTINDAMANYQVQLQKFRLKSVTVVVHENKCEFLELLESEDLEKYVK